VNLTASLTQIGHNEGQKDRKRHRQSDKIRRTLTGVRKKVWMNSATELGNDQQEWPIGK
jgi:hypothetical protein